MSRKVRRSELARRKRAGEWGPDGWKFKRGDLPDVAVYPSLHNVHAVWINATYIVLVDTRATEWGPVEHLAIRRHDGKPVRSWTHMQRIKDTLVGADRIAVEVYPRASEVVNDAHMYHLWVLPEGKTLPFRLVSSRSGGAHA